MKIRLFVCIPLLLMFASFPVAAQDLGNPQPASEPSKPKSAGNGESQLGGESLYGGGRTVELKNGRFAIPDLRTPTIAMGKIGNGSLPDAISEPEPRVTQPLPEGPGRSGNWAISAYLWHAPNTFSNPLYFEDIMLERHGQERCPPLQPLVSGARFFATIPMLPYLATIQDPCDCVYTLGYYRSGTCAPALCQRPPYQRNAALVEAAAIAGGFIALP